MQKIVLFLILLICRQTTTMHLTACLNYVLEPPYPHITRHASAKFNVVKIVQWASQDPIFRASVNRCLLKYIWGRNPLNEIKYFLTNPCWWAVMLTSLPTVEHLTIPLFKCKLGEALLGTNIMMYEGRKIVHNYMKTAMDTLGPKPMRMGNKQTPEQTTTTFNRYTIFSSIACTCASIMLVAFSHALCPKLYIGYSYFDISELTSKLPSVLNKSLWLYLTYQKGQLLTNQHKAFTTVNQIFEIKKMLFLNSIIITFFLFTLLKSFKYTCHLKFKPSNALFTDPRYWLTIGIAHKLFLDYECHKKIAEKLKTSPLFIKIAATRQDDKIVLDEATKLFFNICVNYCIPISSTILFQLYTIVQLAEG